MTTSTSSASTWPARAGRATLYAAGQIALVLALWLSLMRFPAGPATGLDPSWRMILGYALEHGWQFGRDLVFTYGPLGFLLGATNSGGLYAGHLAWQLGANFAFALSFWLLGRSFTGWRKVVYYLYLFCLGVVFTDGVHITLVALFSLGLLRPAVFSRWWLSIPATWCIAALALIKFTNFTLAGFAIAAVLAFHGSRRQWPALAAIGGGFAVALLGGWVLLGQSLGNLPAYVLNSLSVSAGYVEAMGLEPSAWMLTFGVAALVTLGAYYVLALYRAPDLPRSLAAVLIAAAASFLSWKHGFVRADGHVLAHYQMCLFFACTCPVILQDDGPFRRIKGSLLVACAAFGLAGIWANTKVTIIYAPSVVNAQIIDNTNMLSIIQDVPRNGRAEFAAAKMRFELPGIKALTAGKPVDIFGNEQAYALFNDLNYHPRPALQSYAAYNERLEQINLDFMASDRAPAVVLQKLNSNTIDDRLPSLDDALAVRYLYHHYEYVMEEQDFLVWKRKGTDAALDAKTPLNQVTARFGEQVKVPNLDDTPIWCELDVQPSFLGRLRTFFYKPPILRLAVDDGSGTTSTFRIIAGQARTGFLAYPHFTSNFNVAKYQAGEKAPHIFGFKLVLPKEDLKYFAASTRISFYQLPAFPRSGHVSEKPPEVRYRVFNALPTSVNAPFPPEIMAEGGKEVLFTHPPATIEFRPKASDRHITGKFGFITRAYAEGNTTDGAEFIVEWIDPMGKVYPLFSRHLQPLKVFGDRGEQGFDTYIPPGEGRLLLRITPGPAGNIAFDWTYWTDLKITK